MNGLVLFLVSFCADMQAMPLAATCIFYCLFAPSLPFFPGFSQNGKMDSVASAACAGVPERDVAEKQQETHSKRNSLSNKANIKCKENCYETVK